MNNILRPLALFASIFLAGTLGAQTIIPLQRGQGGIRSKTVDDYKRERHTDKREQSDSLAYVDNLRRAFNALYADSLGQAETLFNEALKLRPAAEGNHIIKYNLGLVDMARGRNVQAVEKLTAVIKDYPQLLRCPFGARRSQLATWACRRGTGRCATSARPART